MKLRRVVSLTALLLSPFVLLTSVILYIVPQGRVAYWADWRLWGLSKEQWGALHINIGLLFLIALLLHVYYNWKPITLYLKNKAKKVRVFTAEFNVALILVAACLVGTYMMLPPFSTILDINARFQAAGAQKYGEPPYGHAELSSLKTFTRQMGIDLLAAQTALKDAGIVVDDVSASIKDIAGRNNLSPQQVYLIIRPLAAGDITGATETGGLMPASPPPGLGNLTVNKVIQRYNLKPDAVAQALSAENIAFTPEMKLKEIAAKSGVGPIDVYVVLREGVQQ